MYLQRIRARNFRAFGDGTTSPVLDWELSPEMNILVGENDAGKSAVIDAIRHVLWTTSYEFVRLVETDFHVSASKRSNSLSIEATLAELSTEQEAAVLEWLTHESDGSRRLILHLQARWIPPVENRRGRVDSVTRAGRDGVGLEIGSAVRELVRATYLRPLRDAEAELQPGRQSRLSQILGSHKSIGGQEANDFVVGSPEQIPKKLVGLMAFVQHHLGEHEVIKGVEKDINDNYLNKFALAEDKLTSRIQMAPDLALQSILERFELALLPSGGISREARCSRGLGYNNALFMATELVLLRDGEELALLLVEEPEAHLHPQLQERVQRLLEQSATKLEARPEPSATMPESKVPEQSKPESGVLDQSATKPEDSRRKVQVVMTTHSPTLAASADVAAMTLVHRAHLFSLAPQKTKLKMADYEFLRRFIDATKANLFFARGVAIVEGPAEALLLPALADACNRSFSRHGISTVNVGNVGLYHYARIFQRADGRMIPMPVVCLTDRDVVPDVANNYVTKAGDKKRFASDYNAAELEALIAAKRARAEGGNTIVCVSDCWTFEYDLARYGCAKLMFKAIHLAKLSKLKGERLDASDEFQALATAEDEWQVLAAAGHSADKLAAIIYQPLHENDASKAVAAQYAAHLVADGSFGSGDELLARLPLYIQRALLHLTGKGAAK